MTTSEQTPVGSGENFPRPDGDPKNERERLNELADRLGAPDGAEKDIALFLAENWQRFLGALVIVLLGVWILNQYRAAELRKTGEASQRFSDVQRNYPKVVTSGQEISESDRTAFTQTLSALQKQSSSEAYQELSGLYQAVAFWRNGDLASAKSILEEHGATAPVGSTAELSSELLIRELASLIYARILISEGTAESVASGTKRLEALASNAQVVNVEATIALFRLAKTEEAKASATEIARGLKTSRPELSSMIEQELSAIGVSIQ